MESSASPIVLMVGWGSKSLRKDERMDEGRRRLGQQLSALWAKPWASEWREDKQDLG